jgi:hypothetical protein
LTSLENVIYFDQLATELESKENMMTNRNEVLETLKKVTRNYAGKAVTAAELALFLDDTKSS